MVEIVVLLAAWQQPSFEGGVVALDRTAVTVIRSCSASTILLFLITDSVAVMRSTTGSSCGEMAKLSPLANT